MMAMFSKLTLLGHLYASIVIVLIMHIALICSMFNDLNFLDLNQPDNI